MHTIIIETDDAYARIQELADREGKSVATIVIEAIDEKLDRERTPQVIEDREQYFLNLGRRIREANPDWNPHADIDALYDPETGLPT